MFMVRIHHGIKEYKVNYLTAQYRHKKGDMRGLPDNGALVSCGLTVGNGPDELPEYALAYLISTGQATPVDDVNKGHGGCQSYCVIRGDNRCQW